MLLNQWNTLYLLTIIGVLLIFYYENTQIEQVENGRHAGLPLAAIPQTPSHVDWATIPIRYPVKQLKTLPPSRGRALPSVQAKFPIESAKEGIQRLERLEAVKSNFTHAWSGYKRHAWLRDEVQPVSGTASDPFGGWAATLVDSLDTLWIMGLRDDFTMAVSAVDKIDFSTSSLENINVFETTIRYLGGFLAAYDLSGNKVLLQKATELGDMLYKAFDTPNRMPITRWNFRDALRNNAQEAPASTLLAEPMSLTLEFTRLSQLTGDSKYYDAVQRVTDVFEQHQMNTQLPGMWPISVNMRNEFFDYHSTFTIGGMADSAYEYLPKQHILLGGATPQYRSMYNTSLTAMKRNIFYRPMTKDNSDILFAGQVHSQSKSVSGQLFTEPQAQHLGCFAGGMVALAAKVFQSDVDFEIGKKLVEGCLWGYESMAGGIMPEIIQTLPCKDSKCEWNTTQWLEAMMSTHGTTTEIQANEKLISLGLPQGVMKVDDTRYILRPEAIESIFVLYRITGDRRLQDRAWNIFQTIISRTKTDIAHAALIDCTSKDSSMEDRMESFWLAETLKYFYLIFSEPDLISLDEYVFNTEAHPLKRPS